MPSLFMESPTPKESASLCGLTRAQVLIQKASCGANGRIHPFTSSQVWMFLMLSSSCSQWTGMAQCMYVSAEQAHNVSLSPTALPGVLLAYHLFSLVTDRAAVFLASRAPLETRNVRECPQEILGINTRRKPGEKIVRGGFIFLMGVILKIRSLKREFE